LPDAWEIARFGDLDSNAAGNDDGDALNNYQEFIAGTHPDDPSSVFAVNVTRAGGVTRVSFHAIAASGPGYEGRDRRYALERSGTLKSDWVTVPGLESILGNDQDHIYFPSESDPDPAFYRARVTLEP